jgi:hypothetical protein
MKWGAFKKDACVAWGKRQYSSILWDIPWSQSWETACAGAAATIHGKHFAKPNRCVNADGHMWGEFMVDDASCKPHWGGFKDDGCVPLSKFEKRRQYSAILWDIPKDYSWEDACSRMPAKVKGQTFDHPTACVKSNASVLISATGIIASTVAGAMVAGPVGSAVASAGTSVAVEAINQSTGGMPLNMWGVFYVEDSSCR